MKKILISIILIIYCTGSSWSGEVEDIVKNAESGNASSQLQLGYMYSMGSGVNQSYKQAIYWFKKSADQGNDYAQVTLGVLYSTGKGVDKNDEQAAYWYAMAANLGNKYAQYHLANNYEKGSGVTKDYKQAIYWYTKAAEQGEIKAQANLGGLLAFGPETLRDEQKAAYWCKRSAENGDVIGQFCLGVLYEFGVGVSQDYRFAYAWANIAGAQGHKEAINKRDAYAHKLSPEPLLEAKKLSLEIQYRIDNSKKPQISKPQNNNLNIPSLSGIQLGWYRNKVDNFMSNVVIDNHIEEANASQFKLKNGNDLSITYHDSKVVFIELDWNGNNEKSDSGVLGFQFGKTTLNDIRQKAGNNGFAYEKLLYSERVVMFNNYEITDHTDWIIVFISKPTELSGHAQEEIGNKVKLVSLILAKKEYLDSIWGEKKVFDSNYKPIPFSL